MNKSLMDFIVEAKTKVDEITTGETAALMKDGNLLLLDVREPGEVREGHLPGSLNIPRGMLEAKADLAYPHREPSLENREQRMIVYCASGARSLLAAATLQEMGFLDVKSMAGGYAAWHAEGREVVTESW